MEPKTVNEAIELILRHFPAKQVEDFRKMTKEAFLLNGHFGIGLWIRNNLIYPNRFREQLEADINRDKVLHPDDYSEFILSKLWDRLQENSNGM